MERRKSDRYCEEVVKQLIPLATRIRENIGARMLYVESHKTVECRSGGDMGRAANSCE